MGVVVGEKLARCLTMRCREWLRRAPRGLGWCTDAGGRALQFKMQSRKVSSAIARIRDATAAYISVLCESTTSSIVLCDLGNLNLSEPGALMVLPGATDRPE